MSLIGALFGDGEAKLNDAVIANDMIAGAKGMATGYLISALEAATPEVRNLFMTNVNQIVQSHQALTELAVKKGWYKPYQAPLEQLQDTFAYSQHFTARDA